MHVARFFIDIAVEYRNNEQRKESTADEAADNDCTHRGNHLSAFAETDCQRQHPKRRRECCNNDWTETMLNAEFKCFNCRYSFFFLLVRIVNKQYGVVNHYTEQHDNADKRYYA